MLFLTGRPYCISCAPAVPLQLDLTFQPESSSHLYGPIAAGAFAVLIILLISAAISLTVCDQIKSWDRERRASRGDGCKSTRWRNGSCRWSDCKWCCRRAHKLCIFILFGTKGGIWKYCIIKSSVVVSCDDRSFHFHDKVGGLAWYFSVAPTHHIFPTYPEANITSNSVRKTHMVAKSTSFSCV